VDPKHVLRVTILFAVIGVIHWLLPSRSSRSPTIRSARKHEVADFPVGPALLRDLRFVVTSAVQMAGVLLVFGFLVIPAVAGLLATRRPGVAMAIGWGFGFLASAMGLVASVSMDMPAAPSILVTLTVFLLVMGLFAAVMRRRMGAGESETIEIAEKEERRGVSSPRA
jgi:zinc/manganese transport system permease protein